MGLSNLEPFISAGPWVVTAALGVPVVGKIIVTALALRGTHPKDRPGIIKAVAELFRWRR
ncbi:hypothetical protein ACFY2Q_27360 [Micromonospora sp. NPDC000316]|uniref:hypothetical protein n=1 Tax=Micromonospora sp. NPDC000316 TaxID=3364216 RepID=UPI0036A46DB3